MRIAGKSIAFSLMTLIALGIAPKVKADWSIFEQTSIDGTVSGSIRKGHVFKTISGNLYEVTDHVYLYEYEYRPDVVVLRDGNIYQLIIDGFDEPLTCRRLTGSARPRGIEMSVLDTDTVKGVQAALKLLGFEVGAVDGVFGPRTRSALSAFQSSNGLENTAKLNASTLQLLSVELYSRFPNDTKVQNLALALFRRAKFQGAGGSPPGLNSGVTPSRPRRGYPIEVAHNDELFVINGEKYKAKTYCLGWEEGEAISFLEGSAFGACVSAKLLNLDREDVCEVWCE